MLSPLPEHVQEDIYRIMKYAFRELPFYEKIIEPKIMKVIRDADKVEMNHKVHKRLTEKYYDVAEFNKTEQGKLILTQIHIAVRACYVLILAHAPEQQDLLWKDVEQLLQQYPEFRSEPEQEQKYLLQFRNMMCLALLIVPARLNKKLLINIAARLEGSDKEYITGGGQKPCVTRRVKIYEREGNISAEKRDERMRNRLTSEMSDEFQSDASSSVIGKKRTQLNPSMKKLKMIRLDSEEAKQLVRTTVALPPTALLTLSRECSKHLLEDHDILTNTASLPFSSVLEDLLQFQPNVTTSVHHQDTRSTSSASSTSSFLVPVNQACSGTLSIPLSLSRSTSRSQFPSSSSPLPPPLTDGHPTFQFPPGLLSRQQSELLATLWAQPESMAWLMNWDTAVVTDTNNNNSSCNILDTNTHHNHPHHALHQHHHALHHQYHHVSGSSSNVAPVGHAANAHPQDVTADTHDNRLFECNVHHHHAAMILPMLRAVSWDVVENNGFSDDLAQLLSSF